MGFTKYSSSSFSSPARNPRGSDMMYTSPETIPFTPSDTTKYTFTAFIKGSQDPLKFHLSKLFHPHSQDLFSWISEIKNAFYLCGWTEDYGYSLLHVLVDTEYHGILAVKGLSAVLLLAYKHISFVQQSSHPLTFKPKKFLQRIFQIFILMQAGLKRPCQEQKYV
ncbi:hypothetical protein ENBRE01_0077 [Enteropsectra breve]|nr:hypothetical protein ENBRE01_0077 [Enteropsectra breve]